MNEIKTTQLDATLGEAWDAPEKLPEMREWLKEKRGEATQSQYASIIVKKHFARNGVELKRIEVPVRWRSFGLDLDWNIHSFVREGNHSAMLKNMFAELVDFCEAIPDEFFTYRLLQFLENFIDRDPPFSLIVPLLPAKALGKFDELNEMLTRQHEEDLERQNQMGY